MPQAPIGSVKSLAESGIKDLPLSLLKDEHERPTVLHNVFSHDIPVISLLNSRGQQRDRVRAELKKACQEWGMFQVVDHGVPMELTNLIMSNAMDFFSLPLEEKIEYAFKPGTYFGYGNGSYIKDDPLMDWRELYAARCFPRDPNSRPSKPPTMRKSIAEYSDATVELIQELLELISEALGLECKAIENASGDAELKLLMNYYPKCSRPDLTLGSKRHRSGDHNFAAAGQCWGTASHQRRRQNLGDCGANRRLICSQFGRSDARDLEEIKVRVKDWKGA